MLFILALLLFSPAAEALTLSPGVLKIQAEAGESRTYTIKVFNEGKQALQITPAVQDWAYNPKGEKIFRPAGTLPFSLAPYVKLETTPFVLGSRQSRQVNLQVNVPADKLGGHHAMAFFHAVPYLPQPQPFRSQVKMAIRLGTTLLYENPASSVIQSRILAVEAQAIERQPKLQLKVKNEGNTWINSAATVAVLDSADNLLGTFKLSPQIVLRGQQATLSAHWKHKLKPGTYHLLITYQYREKSTTVSRNLTVS